MIAVKKYISFDELKSSEKKTVVSETILNRHLEFEKVIKSIYNTKVRNSDLSQKKP